MNAVTMQTETPVVGAVQWMKQHQQSLLLQIPVAGWDVRSVNLAQSDCTAEWGPYLRTHEE